MTYLEEKRQRIADMIAELKADPWMTPRIPNLEELLDDEQLAAVVVAHRRGKRELEAWMALRGHTCWGDGEPALIRYSQIWNDGARNEASYLRTISNRLAKIDPSDEQAMKQPVDQAGNNTAGIVRAMYKMVEFERAKVKQAYSDLSERERRFLTKPVPNPVRVDEFPRPGEIMRGYFYPSDTPVRHAAIMALEEQFNA